jgi:hypothetical protein
MAVVVVGDVVPVGSVDNTIGDEAIQTVAAGNAILDHQIFRDLMRVEAIGRAILDLHTR